MNSDRSKYLLWAGIVAVVLIITFKLPLDHKIYRADDNGNRAVDTNTPETKEQQKFSFSLDFPSFFSDDTDRITNENCGISFKIPEGWIVEDVKAGNRYCLYRIDNPAKRGATLEIGVPITNRQEVYWNDVMSQLGNPEPVDSRTIDGAETYLYTFAPQEQQGGVVAYGDPMYLLKKDQAIYYVRYGYVPSEDNMIEDIQSVLSSFRFIHDREFYTTPLFGTQ